MAKCDAATTAIAQIQSDNATSSLAGTEVTIRGVVTWLDGGSGFTLEEPGSDNSAWTSNGIYVKDETLSRMVKVGQRWLLTGQVSELGKSQDTLTSISLLSAHQLCAAGIALPVIEVSLPLDSRQREAIESMRVSLAGPLLVADVYSFYRGEILLSSNQPLRIPTEDAQPGEAAIRQGQENRKNTIQAGFKRSESSLLHHGSSLQKAAGVMGHNGRNQLLLIEGAVLAETPLSPGVIAAEGGITRVVSMNLLNFFNGDGLGRGFPTERGARSLDSFANQSRRIQSALSAMQPGILAVQELENDGYGPHSAARSLLDLLDVAVPGKWAVVETSNGRMGTDVISVGLFYRLDLIEAVGPPAVLDGAPFRNLSRQPLAQLFRERASGVQFLVAVNHLKSKGSCPQSGINADQGDGQGCWNPARVEAATAVAKWAHNLSQAAGTGHVIILGDMNAYRNEDPIHAFRKLAYTELVEHVSGLPQHSYVFRGESGTLDYAFATKSLLNTVSNAEIWHVNAAWPQKTELSQPWLRFSDHDPVLIDLDFSHAETSD